MTLVLIAVSLREPIKNFHKLIPLLYIILPHYDKTIRHGRWTIEGGWSLFSSKHRSAFTQRRSVNSLEAGIQDMSCWDQWLGANEGTKLNKRTRWISKHSISLLVYFYPIDYLEGYTGLESAICKPVMFSENCIAEFYVLLTVHLGSVLVNKQLDAQFFFFSYIFIPILYVFRALVCSSSGVSELDPNLHTRRSPTWRDTCMLDGVLIQLILLMMSTGVLETCRELE